ncbi:MAG: AMP-binding protein, partial [Deltaproteobacteria bacterium RBG_13_47_9]
SFPENDALVDISLGVKYSYREFLKMVNRLAKGFLTLGLKPGDHAALWFSNRWEWIVCQFALAKIGVVLISVDPQSKLQQLEYLLKQSDSCTLILMTGLKGSEYLEMIDQLCPEAGQSIPGQLNCASLPGLKNLILISDQTIGGMFTWQEILGKGKDVSDTLLAEREDSCRTEDVATILYTSGTTGSPKGVMSTHFGMINATLGSAENQRLNHKDRLCLSVPLSHMFGCICIALAAIIKGAALIIPSDTFDPRKILESIEKERCTAIYGSPNVFISLMEDPQYPTLDMKSLRTGIMGGAQCPMEVMKKVVEEMGAREIVIGYGQTESSSWITETRPDDPLDLRVSTVGRPLPNVEVKIIDPKTGEEVPSGTAGELCARGLNMKGYYKMPAATEKALDREGWLHTGDLATMDQKGYVRTTGRLKEVITKGGEVIFPTEIEELLFAHPHILNVQIFGVPDKDLDEEVAAWIKLEEGAELTEQEIVGYCKKRLPESHLPRYIKFVKEFPMTPLGKIQKFKMREIAIMEYGLPKT